MIAGQGDVVNSAEVPDVVGTVRAYRNWVAMNGQLYPRTMTMPHTWAGPDAVAWCPKHRVAPGYLCECGLYACTDPFSNQLWLRWVWRAGQVDGVVECSGVIIEQEKNSVIRVQRARIVALHLPRGFPRAHRYASRYGVRVFRSRTAMLRAYPPDTPVRLLRRRLRQGRDLLILSSAFLNLGIYAADTTRHLENFGAALFLLGVWSMPWVIVAINLLVARLSEK